MIKNQLPLILALIFFVVFQAIFIFNPELTTDFSISRSLGAGLITAIGYGIRTMVKKHLDKKN